MTLVVAQKNKPEFGPKLRAVHYLYNVFSKIISMATLTALQAPLVAHPSAFYIL